MKDPIPTIRKEVQRNFILGDEWLYYKIYTGINTSDTILCEVIKPVANMLLEKKVIDKWFFIRYADPHFHLRVRFHYKNPENIGTIINSLYPYFKEFIDQDFIWNIQIDTYQREVERYGANTIDLSEELFYYDSLMVTEFIEMIEGNDGEDLRWHFALRAIDSFLNSFQYKDQQKLFFLEKIKNDFSKEFGITRPYKKQIDKKYRKERSKIDDFMVFTEMDKPDFAPILYILDKKDKAIKNITHQILQLKNQDKLKTEFQYLIGSYIHMFMNRLFKSKNRLHEMVCYDFLFRYYKSMIARKR